MRPVKLLRGPVRPIPRNPNAEQSGPFVMIQGPQTDVISYKRVETCLNPKSLPLPFLLQPSDRAAASSRVGRRSPRPGRIRRVQTRRARAWQPLEPDAGAPWGQAAPAARVTRLGGAVGRTDRAPVKPGRRLVRLWRSASRGPRAPAACSRLPRTGRWVPVGAAACRALQRACRPRTARALDRQRSATVCRVPLGQGQQADA